MNIETEMFKKCIFDSNKLISFGFQEKEDKYYYGKDILNDKFRILIEISKENIVRGTIYDMCFHEEYNNFRRNQKGKFAQSIYDEFMSLLNEIKESCTYQFYFLSSKANQIANYIINHYQIQPEFLWNKYPDYGVFRNPKNKKWFAIIMNINKNKIDKGEKEVNIINVKLKKEKIQSLLNQKGFYEAYHMNKKNWISIILDETMNDLEIITYIEESYKLTENNKN